MQVEFETKLWITPYDTTPVEMLGTPDGARSLTFSANDMEGAGWTLAGTAKVVAEIADRKTLVDNKVQALRQEAKNIRAEATMKCTKIDGQIQQLLCIENTL